MSVQDDANGGDYGRSSTCWYVSQGKKASDCLSLVRSAALVVVFVEREDSGGALKVVRFEFGGLKWRMVGL